MQIVRRIEISPFLKILPLFAAGILCYRYVSAPDEVLYGITVAVYILAWVGRTSRYGGWYIAVSLFLSGMTVTALTVTREQMPRGEPLEMILEVNRTPSVQGRWQRTPARAGGYRPIGQTSCSWIQVNEIIELNVDTSNRIYVGEQLRVKGILYPVDTAGSRYGALMRSRGISSRSYIASGGVSGHIRSAGRRMTRLAAAVQDWGAERIDRLHLDAQQQGLLTALIVGQKRDLSRDLRSDYSKTGTAHILAVSGLHMSFVLVLANLLFGWMVLLRRGHRIKNVLVIAFLWSYALMSGFSPSVIRAALMLSAGQLALASSSEGNSYNITLGCATLMLAVNPFYLYDVSFQLSFMAVLSILFFFPRLYRRRLSRHRVTDTLLSSLLLGVAAQIGTLPLVVYHFGNIPLIGIWINPVVIFTSFLIIFVGLIWILVSWIWLVGLFSGVLGGLAWVQNSVVSWAASVPFASVSGIHMEGYGVLLAYVLLGVLALGIKMKEQRDQMITESLGTEIKRE